MCLNKSYFILVTVFFIINCGSNSSKTASSDESTQFNTTKLIGTPFEGLETGDEFPYYYFICDQFKTETIDSLPIYIFAAFFTEEEESIIQDGVNIANEAIGFMAYELTNTWSDDVRVIYKVNTIDGAVGKARTAYYYFNGNVESESFVPDWQILIEAAYVSKWVVAHELGHAMGIRGHSLIDYENDTTAELEENSLMEPNLPTIPLLNDYSYMMNMQGQIMQNHLGEIGELRIDWCE